MKKLFIAMAALMLASCSKTVYENPTPAGNQEYDFAKDLEIMQIAANPDNPYDDFGKHHFYGVVDVMSKLGNSQDINQIIELSNKYAASINQEGQISKAGTVERELTEAEIIKLYNNAKNKYTFALGANPSRALQTKVNEFSKTIEALSKNPDNYSYAHIYKNVVNFEQSVLNDVNLIENDREIILKGTSTFRYSTVQWEQPIESLTNPALVPNIIPMKAKKIKWFHWLIIGAVDAGGAILGGVAGAVTASTLAYTIIKDQLRDDLTVTPAKP